jgi:uncharacterized protein
MSIDSTAENVESDRASGAIAGDDDEGTLLGYVNFDTSGGHEDTPVLVDFKYISGFRRGKYVFVGRRNADTRYLGRMVEGPYFVPDYVSTQSSIARVAIQKADLVKVLPDYHAQATIEILGVIDRFGVLHGSATRPAPQMEVRAVEGQDLINLIGLHGGLLLGNLDGYSGVPVRLDCRRDDPAPKKVLPRNVGIFGTVGSGKTNTSQVLIEQAARNGWAVIVLDVEGEYCEMNQPNDEAPMRLRMTELGLAPAGVPNFAVYRPTNAPEDDAFSSTPFSLKFGRLDPYMVAEVLGMNDPQEDRFLQVYESVRRFPIPPVPEEAKSKTKKTRKGLIEDSEEEEIAEEETVARDRPGATFDAFDESVPLPIKLEELIDRINAWVDSGHDDDGRQISFKTSWQKVRSQLTRLLRLRLFDTEADHLAAQELLKAGKVSVINLADSNDPRVNNLVIADILGEVFRFKKDNQDPPVMIVIEEAHTFVSKENVKRMQATMDRLREIARRGRKRWLSLAFISQQPSHLPAELYELCNNLFVHETKGSKNLDALKASAGTLNEAIWRDVPSLGQGRCIVMSPQLRHPIVTQMNPSESKRRMTD